LQRKIKKRGTERESHANTQVAAHDFPAASANEPKTMNMMLVQKGALFMCMLLIMMHVVAQIVEVAIGKCIGKEDEQSRNSKITFQYDSSDKRSSEEIVVQ